MFYGNMLYGKSKRLEKLNPPGGSEKQRFPFMQQLTFSSVRLWKLPRDWSFFAEMGSLVPANTAEEPLTSGSPAVFVRQGEQGKHSPWFPRAGFGANGLCWELRVKGVVHTLENSVPRAMINEACNCGNSIKV